MNELLRSTILQYTGFNVENNKQNLLDIPVHEEVWLYIIIELEEKYNLPMLKVIEEINAEEFNLETICNKLKMAL